MSELTFHRMYNGAIASVLRDRFHAVNEATQITLDLYKSIADLDAQNPEPNRIITRHLGAIAVVKKPAGTSWGHRVSELILFGDEELIDNGDLPKLFMTKALQRAVRAEEKYQQDIPDYRPPYEYLGMSNDYFSVGVAGPYPLHTTLVLDQFAKSMWEYEVNGSCGAYTPISEVAQSMIKQGQKGGNDGDAGDNTPEMKDASLPFREFVEDVISG